MKKTELADCLAEKGYILESLLGEGAFAKVYCVTALCSKKRYACKISRQPEILKRETVILRRFRGNPFPAFQAYWEVDQAGFLVEELVDGVSVAEWIRQKRDVKEMEAVELCRRLAEVLLSLHTGTMPLIYRDLKPEHIMLQKNGTLRLLDPGSVGEIGSNTVRTGTLGFGAPEQFIRGGPIGFYSDVYGLCALLKYLLSEKKELDPILAALLQSGLHPRWEERLPDMRCVIYHLMEYGETKYSKKVHYVQEKGGNMKWFGNYVYQENVCILSK